MYGKNHWGFMRSNGCCSGAGGSSVPAWRAVIKMGNVRKFVKHV